MENEISRTKLMEPTDPKAPALRYVIISPVKDEEQYVELTLRSVTSQTVKPVAWILVDDGSRDRTPEIISRYAEANSFIRLIRNPHTGARRPGSAVIRAFNVGYQALGEMDYDFIVKLDCDISFAPDYFQQLLGRFAGDERLGIASGVYFEINKEGVWKEVPMPSYHAAGASKVVRRLCFEDIAGFIVSAGWDTVDEIRAMTRGWKTLHYPELQMHHHKPEGSGIGPIRTSIMHGEIYYLTGGDKLFFLLKILHRIGAKPFVLNALALIGGYLRARMRRKRLLVTKEEALCYQDLLRDRMLTKVKTLIGWN
jgi:poly-beta-1,6-N-acetyl-D-glucosamine synthase